MKQKLKPWFSAAQNRRDRGVLPNGLDSCTCSQFSCIVILNVDSRSFLPTAVFFCFRSKVTHNAIRFRNRFVGFSQHKGPRKNEHRTFTIFRNAALGVGPRSGAGHCKAGF